MNKKLASLFTKPHICILIFFLVYFIIGVSIYKDYGISWDEPTHREIAGVSAKYVLSILKPDFQHPELASKPNLSDYSAKQYGVIFDLPMYIADIMRGYNGKMSEAYYMRHLCIFLLFYISVFLFLVIVKNRFNSWELGLTACLFLILSPRIFAHSFYGKDVVFLSLFIIAIYFFLNYLERKTSVSAVLFGFSTALLVDQRITGIFVPFLAVLMTVIDIAKQGHPFRKSTKILITLFIYLFCFCFFMVMFWPYLWERPLSNFLDAFNVMKRYSVFSYDILYFGKYIKSTAVPWHYIPVWMLITTPLLYTFFFFLGLTSTIKVIIRNRVSLYSNKNEQQDFLFVLLFFMPLAAVIVLHSALYDGWRHMYFLYAPFLLIAMTGFKKMWDLMKKGASLRERFATIFITAVIVFSVIGTSYQMISNHPFQNVYFNILAAEHAGQNYELDYWGLSFRQGLQYIVQNDKRPEIKLSANLPMLMKYNAIFLDKRDISRLRLTDISQADYFLTNYRWHPQPYPIKHEYHSILVDGNKIISIFKLR